MSSAKLIEMMSYLADRPGEDVSAKQIAEYCKVGIPMVQHQLNHQISMGRIYKRDTDVFRISSEGIRWVDKRNPVIDS